MIQKAIEKIDGEINSDNPMVMILGECVKSELLTSDSNALKILAPNTDLDTFAERLEDVAASIKKFDPNNDKVEDVNELGKKVIAIIKGVKIDDVSEADFFLEIGKICSKSPRNDKNNSIGLTSKICIPLLRIYYGIPLEPAAEKESAPKRRRFNTVSLD